MADVKVTDEQILSFIAQFWKKNGYAPSVRELGDGVGLRSSSTVHARLKALKRQGRILSNPEQKRTLRLPGFSGDPL